MMVHAIFILAGLVSAVHVYTYGRWLKRQGKIPGAIVAFFFAAAAFALPLYHYLKG